jgi:hypothetical protein
VVRFDSPEFNQHSDAVDDQYANQLP